MRRLGGRAAPARADDRRRAGAGVLPDARPAGRSGGGDAGHQRHAAGGCRSACRSWDWTSRSHAAVRRLRRRAGAPGLRPLAGGAHTGRHAAGAGAAAHAAADARRDAGQRGRRRAAGRAGGAQARHLARLPGQQSAPCWASRFRSSSGACCCCWRSACSGRSCRPPALGDTPLDVLALADPAVHRHRLLPGRPDRAHHPVEPAVGADQRLRPHRARQRPGRRPRSSAATRCATR